MKRTIIDASQLELNDRVVAIKRVSKTVKGGRTMRFSALVVVGDGNGHVGVGLGKAGEVPEAIRKGKEAAVKSLVEIPIDENKSIPHDFIGKFGSASVLLKRAPEGTGIIAGGPARAVVELAGIKNIRTKSLGSNNKTNVVLATVAGLTALKTPEEFARLRGKSVEEIVRLIGGNRHGREVKESHLVKSLSVLFQSREQLLRHLDLEKCTKTVEMPDNGAVRGMIQRVRHLVKVEEI